MSPIRRPPSTTIRSTRSTRPGTSCRRRPPPAASKASSADFVWRIVSPYLQRQLTFNSWLVDHLNRNLAAAREAHQAALEDVEAIRAHSGALGGVPGAADPIPAADHALRRHPRSRASEGGALVLNSAISGLARQRGQARRVGGGARRQDRRAPRRAHRHRRTLRAAISVVQQASLVLKREVARLLTGIPHSRPTPADGCGHFAAAPGIHAGARRLQIPGIRGSLSRLARRHHVRDSRATCRSSRAPRTSSTSAAAAGSSSSSSVGAGDHGARNRSESRDGGDLPRKRTRRHRSGRRELPVVAARRSARRPVRRAGRRAPAAGLPALVPGARLPQAAARQPHRPRDAQPRRAGSPSSRATSATSRMSGRCIRRRCSSWSSRAASRAPTSSTDLQSRTPTSFSR